MSATQNKRVTLDDKTFEVSIPYSRLDEYISVVAQNINNDYKDCETPLFLGILNGAFMFMSELMQKIEFNCELSFVKLASYSGTGSTGCVSELIGLNGDISGRHIIVVEDIVDTGTSIEHMIKALEAKNPASIQVATMFYKPEAYSKPYEIKYPAINIANDFIVGFGLDYNQLGRNLKDIYKIVEE